MDIATRNRRIKQVCEQAFGKGKVSVRGHRGTSYGWVTVSIAYAPRNRREYRELSVKVNQLLDTAKIDVGTFGYDDPGSDYGYGKRMHVNFEQCREKSDSWGEGAWRHELSAEDWDRLQLQERAA